MRAAFIQARMSSTRLPGKVLFEINGKPLLSYTIRQLKECRRLHHIQVLTSDHSSDEPIVSFARKQSIAVSCGSLNDVLDRYYQAARQLSVKEIVRITGDCPLIDPELVDRVVGEFQKGGFDYVHTGARFPDGVDVEVIRFDALERSWAEASEDYQREHVTAYVREKPEEFKISTVDSERDLSGYRWSVDEQVDYDLVRAVIEGIGKEGGSLTMEAVIEFLNSNPEVRKLNQHVIRNEGLIISKRKGDRGACDE